MSTAIVTNQLKALSLAPREMGNLDIKQDLYPGRSTTSFGSHNASLQDIPVGDENIEPGMPTFSHNGQIQHHDKNCLLRSTSSLSTTLEVGDDTGTPLSMSPSKAITVQEYKAALNEPNVMVAPFHQVESAIRGPEEIELPILCNSTSKVVRFVFEALRTIVQEKIPVADWDDNDYTNLAILAKSLHTKDIKLSDLIYQPDSPLVKEQILIAAAILAYIKMIDLKCKSDEELFEDWGNDRPLFFKGLRLEKLKQYPLFAEATEGL